MEAEKRSNDAMNFFDALPDVLIFSLFYALPSLKDCGRFGIVCKRFYNLVNSSEREWKPVLQRWWRAKDLEKYFDLTSVVEDCIKWCGRGWKWIASCASQYEREAFTGIGWKKQDWPQDQQAAFDIGEFKDGFMEGTGMRLYISGRFVGDRCVGDFKGGRRNGKGYYMWSDKTRYEGQFEKARLCGYGVKVWPNGIKYQGMYSGDHETGEGVMTWTDGFEWKGQWNNGVPGGKFCFLLKMKANVLCSLEDEQASIHPKIRTLIQEGKCTTNQGLHLGQYMYLCTCCNGCYCQSCKESCHQPNRNMWGKLWVFADGECHCTAQPQHCFHTGSAICLETPVQSHGQVLQ